MGFVLQFGIALGLSGVTGARAYFPLVVVGLLTRFSEIIAYRPPFKIFASVPFLLLFVALAAFELTVDRGKGVSGNYFVLSVALKVISGAVVFAGLFGGLGTLAGLFFGGGVAFLSYLSLVRLKAAAEAVFRGTPGIDSSGTEEFLAVAGTLLAVLFPWSSYFIWGAIILILLKKTRENSGRYKQETKARSWR